MYYRKIALAALLASGLALPALAQTAAPAAQADTTNPIPDVGVKKAPAPTVKHVRHTSHTMHKAKSAPTKAR
jgi:hypothetical protein